MQVDEEEEEERLSPTALRAQQETFRILQCASNLADELKAVPTLVDLRKAAEYCRGDTGDHWNSLLNNRGESLQRALSDLEFLQKESYIELLQESSTIVELTNLVLQPQESLRSAEHAIESLRVLGRSIPRRVCQHPFKRNDIVWVCRTCQADETCVLCHSCYKQSNHEGHDVAFYHAQAGGCCDCGDPDAWDPAGFCPHHGTSGGSLPEAIVQTVKGLVPALAQWLVDEICQHSHRAHERAKLQEQTRSNTATPFVVEQQQQRQQRRNVNEDEDMGEDNEDEVDDDDDEEEEELDDESDDHQMTMQSDSGRAGMRNTASREPSPVERLGRLAHEEDGLYLVLHADDIHTAAYVATALRTLLGGSGNYTDHLFQKLVKALLNHGQVVVWGTMELLGERTTPQRLLWLDGDRTVQTMMGTSILERASRLQGLGLSCSIVTRKELQWEQRAVAVLEWLTALARSCDPLCQTVAECILPKYLVPMLQADFHLPSPITTVWHSLLLTLLAVPKFKSHLAAAYCDTYRHVTSEYARGMGVLERSGYTLSVQFLNRVTYVVDLVQSRDLLGKLGKSLYETLLVAKKDRRLNPNHFCLTHRRYSPCVSDLKCVLNVKGMARLFASRAGTFMGDWLASLALAQCMDGQVWRSWSEGHVETEPRGWLGAFNASISLGSLFERLLSWDDDDPSPAPDSPLSKQVPSIIELAEQCLVDGLLQWHTQESAHYHSTPNSVVRDAYRKCPAALPYSTTCMPEQRVAFVALPFAQITPWSFHLPLHRFVAACLREVCRRPRESMDTLLGRLTTHGDKLYAAVMEFPVIVLSRSAQVRAGLWRRNGSPMHDQVLNYAEPPFCRALRDADVLLLQFGTLGRGTAPTLHLLIHRFGLFDFLGFAKAPNENQSLYIQQVEAGLFSAEQRSEEEEEESLPLPWTYSLAKDVSSSLALLEELLHLLIILMSELPPEPPANKTDHTAQAKLRLKREVIHRLASGPKTHSELTEVHHVLSNWDNVFLSEEGKQVNPDDATGAALGETLSEVAERKISRGRLEPDQWELRASGWDDYDPSFYHISLRSHQSAAESRPTKTQESSFYGGIEPRRYAPPMPFEPHPSFARLRRDVTADKTVLAIAYRTLHIHCRVVPDKENLSGLRGKLAYDGAALSETALARVIHLLTLGAFAWECAVANDANWQTMGGSFPGSVFYGRSEAPTTEEWIKVALLSPPNEIMHSDWYAGQETALVMLRRLAIEGGSQTCGFVAQDQAVRAGAAWLCEFASKHSPEADQVVGAHKPKKKQVEESGESELQRKKREARMRAMERMNAQAARFAAMMQLEPEETEDENSDEKELTNPMITDAEEGDNSSVKSARSTSQSSTVGSEASFPSVVSKDPVRFSLETRKSDPNEKHIPDRLLQSRPTCIICNEDNPASRRAQEISKGDEQGQRKRTRRKTDTSNALAFVGYAQVSTVLKGGGGPPPTIDDHSPLSAVRRFAGIHVALCGHAVHYECCESYLATVLHREDRIVGRREEFKCPLCQRLSNGLVPFIDVGLDWVDSPFCLPCNDDMQMDDGIQHGSPPPSLHEFLSSTPWWVGRHDKSVVWDGQSAFVAAPVAGKETMDQQISSADTASPKPRRRSVRSLRKKDLYAAWSAMMRTPRFIRRRQLSRGSSTQSDSSTAPDASSLSIPVPDDTGETLVWRRFMDLLSDMAYRGDSKRLGEDHFLQYCGEFRHYHVERHAHNLTTDGRPGREHVDWPACISTKTLSDMRRQELSREKLLSKLLMSVQAFTYSCCCEAYEVKRLMKKERAGMEYSDVGIFESTSIKALFSKYGITGLSCDDQLVLIQPPVAHEDEGTQPFDGRLGKLRYFGLAVMAAAGAVSADLVQLVFALPLSGSPGEAPPAAPQPRDGESVHRAPVTFPILFGHVLSHVVAALCATCGRARARSDSLDLVWPAPFSQKGSFIGLPKDSSAQTVDAVVKDCEGFIQLGLLARVLQVLVGKMQIEAGSKGIGRRLLVIKSIRSLMEQGPLIEDAAENDWQRGCYELLEAALSRESSMSVSASEMYGSDTLARFQDACMYACEAAVSYLADIGTIYQVLVPGVVSRHQDKKKSSHSGSTSLGTLQKLSEEFGFESVSTMMKSSLVRYVVATWFSSANEHANKAEATNPSDPGRALINRRLYQTEGFRVYDWPLDSCRRIVGSEDSGKKKSGVAAAAAIEEPQDDGSPMEVDSYPGHMLATRARLHPKSTGPLVAFSSRKSVQFLGGYVEERNVPSNVFSTPRPRIHMLPTSYTDLYAELGAICPDSEQTALCLICGEVLNANGKGECTKHSFKCGAGACIFFLLQECQGLIMHVGKAVYVQSPYVDSHGETPQYRGRPLNLDLDRYEIFRELWTGHAIRQKVVQERGSARQVIITDFY